MVAQYSPMYDGGFCLPCVLFGNDTTFERLDKETIQRRVMKSKEILKILLNLE